MRYANSLAFVTGEEKGGLCRVAARPSRCFEQFARFMRERGVEDGALIHCAFRPCAPGPAREIPRLTFLESHCRYILCLNHIIMLRERHLMRILRSYFVYYHQSRTHLSLNRNSPRKREVERPENGKIFAVPQVGGLHHRYCRAA